MNGVIGMAHLLLDSGLEPQHRSWVEIIRHSAHSLLALINNSLDFSRLQSGQIDFEDVDFDLRVTLHEVENVLSAVAREKQLEIRALVHHEVPSRLRGDAGRLRQVLQNMLSTALRSADGGDVLLVVERTAESEDRVTLTFHIRGANTAGSETHMASAFEAFVNEDLSAARKLGADGLGLAVARQLVTMLKGEVGVERDDSNGITPWFTLGFEKQAEAQAPEEATQVRLRGQRILVVDPSPAARRATHDMLTVWGARADEAANAEEALAELERAVEANDPFQVAIIDMDLPGENGEKLGAKIHAVEALAATRLMLLTGVGRRGDASRVQGLGFSAYLIKPIRWTELHDALTQVVRTDPNADATLVTRHSIAEQRRNSVRILVVDDDPVNQLVMESTLKRHGYTIERSSTAAAALERFDEAPPDLVLLDLALPDMDGYKVAQAIRMREKGGTRTPIIAVTGKMGPGDRQRCLSAGMNDYISKPLDLGDLTASVERWTRGRGARPEEWSAPTVPEEIRVLAPIVGNEEHPFELAPEDDLAVPGDRRASAEAVPVWQGKGRQRRPKAPEPLEDDIELTDPADEVGRAAKAAAAGAPAPPKIEIEPPPPRAPGDSLVLERAPERAMAGQSDPLILDVKRLDDTSMGIPSLRETLLNTFVSDLRPRINRLYEAFINHAANRLEHEAHGLRGMAATIGAVACTTVFTEIERQAHDERWERMEELIEQAREVAREFENHVLNLKVKLDRAA